MTSHSNFVKKQPQLDVIEMHQALGGVSYLEPSIDADVLDITPFERSDSLHRLPRSEADQAAELKTEASIYKFDSEKYRQQEAKWAELRPKVASDLTAIIFNLHGIEPTDSRFNEYFEPEFKKIREQHTVLPPIKK